VSGFVYFVQAEPQGPACAIKIGRCDAWWERRVRATMPCRPELGYRRATPLVLRVIAGGWEVERALHNEFRHLNLCWDEQVAEHWTYGGATELFHPAPELIVRILLLAPQDVRHARADTTPPGVALT